MKGIILAGGSGTRLYPATLVISKQLLPVGDRPMVYYPIYTLMLGGIREIAIISTPRDLPLYRELLGDGSAYGLSFTYIEQERPAGLAQAYVLAEDFVGGEPSCLILGDNVFYGHGMGELMREAVKLTKGGIIFGYRVKDPERYGVVEFDANGKVLSIEEKPSRPKSHFAIPGLYFYDGKASAIARAVTPSERGELEITSIHNAYLSEEKLRVKMISRGIAWLDTGTYESLIDASNFISAVQRRQGIQVACLEEVALRNGWIDRSMVLAQAERFGKTEYGAYLRELAEES